MKRNPIPLCLVFAVVAVLTTLAVAEPATNHEYVFTPFDAPDSVFTFPIGINNNGLITMQYLGGNDSRFHSATLRNGTYTIIDVPDASDTLVSAPNMQGQVALGYYLQGEVVMHAAVYTRGSYAFLPDVPGELNTSPSALNAGGQISGVTWSDNFYVVHGYLWDGSVYNIFDHPDTDIPQTLAMGLNNQGQIVGQYTKMNGEIHGFFKDGDNYTEIAFPGEPNTVAYGINNSGEIVGLCGVAGPGPNGFAVGSQGFILSKGIYTKLVYPESASSFPLGINDTGGIVGVYMGEDGVFHGYLATVKK